MEMNQTNHMQINEKEVKKYGTDSVENKSIAIRIHSFLLYLAICLLNPKYFLLNLPITQKERNEITLAECLYFFGCLGLFLVIVGIKVLTWK